MSDDVFVHSVIYVCLFVQKTPLQLCGNAGLKFRLEKFIGEQMKK